MFLIIGAGYLSDLVFGQVVRPSGRFYFWQLWDTPDTYVSQEGKGIRVNSEPDGLEFFAWANFVEESHLKAVDSATDEDIFTFESTTGDFEWHTIVQMLALTDTDSLSEGSTNLYANTEEEIEDIVGGMLGGTETDITVTYQDGTNDIDFVVISLVDIVTTSPLTVNAGANLDDVIVGGDADITFAIADADDDGSTKGAASFDNTDFNATSGNVTIVDDGHAHTGTSISSLDISNDTNLTAGDALTLTDDDLDFDGGASPGGELGNTWASPTLDDSVAVSSWNLTTPTITSGATYADADISPDAPGELVYDNTVTGLLDGAFAWYDDDAIRYLVDLATLPVNDDYVVAYDSAADGFYMKQDADSGGATAYDNIGDPTGAGSISFDDTETATYTTVQDTAGSFISFINSNADVSNQVYMLDLDYSADTTQDNADFIRLQDAGSTLVVFEEEGKITMTPSGVDDAMIISMTPSTALTAADAAWYGIKIDGDALDPGDVDNTVIGIDVDLSGVDLTNIPYVEALELIMPTGGVALHIEEGKIKQQFTSGSDAGAEYTAIDMFMDASSQAATSETHAIDVAVVGGDPAGLVVGLGTHTYVAPVHQHIGVFSIPDQAGADSEAGFFDDSGTDYIDGVDGIEQFTADDDAIWISAATVFTELEVIMGTPATRSITPTFWYWKDLGVDAWTQFFPADDTDGFQQSGTIRWETTAVPDWLSADVVNISAGDAGEAAAGYWIAIIRTVNADPGTPTPTTVKTGAITEYSWDETGAIDVLSMEADTITEGGNAIPNATDHLGFFGGTTSAELLAEISNETGSGLLVFATAPVFTTSIQLTGADADPAAAAGTIVYDNTLAEMSGGVIRWYDNDSVRMLVDLETDVVDGDDDKVVAYDSAADGFYMKADADTGGATAYDDIGDPDAASTIDFDDDERVTWTVAEDSAASFFTINDSDAALAANTYLLHLLYSVDDDEANADYFKCEDAGGVVFSIQQDGDVTTTGDLDFTNRTSIIQTGTIERIDLDYTLQPAGGLAGTTIIRGMDVKAIWDSDQDGETQDGYINAGRFESKTLDIGATGNIHALRSVTAISYHYGTGTVAEQIGVLSVVNNDDTDSEDGDITAAYNFWASAGTDKGTGTIATRYGYYTSNTSGGGNLTSQYGVYVDDMTGATNDYGIAIAGADTYALWVSSAAQNTDAANGITFGSGGDTNLYRSGVNTLKTDDTFVLAGITATGNADFGGADLELPQASPAVPDVDGEIEIDFTDGKVIIQHGSAHAELGASTDVVVGTLIQSWSATIYEPDGVNDVMTVKAINSIEYPHGVVITAIYLQISEDSNYTLTFQNFDDFDTINGGDPTIDAVAYTANTTGEVIDTTPTYATIAAGQIIMISIPATDVDWIHFEIYFYEPAA
jgi:hypothetical protein